MQDFCPKCDAAMGGPRYDRVADKLVYTCRCGYSVHRTPLDGKPVPSLQDAYARLMEAAGRKES